VIAWGAPALLAKLPYRTVVLSVLAAIVLLACTSSQGRIEEALYYVTKTLEFDPNSEIARRNLQSLLNSQEQHP
jgi:hypothetical protein